MEYFRDDIMRGLLAKSLNTASLDDTGWHAAENGSGSLEGEYIAWLTIKDLVQSVIMDVRRIRFHPLMPKNIPI